MEFTVPRYQQWSNIYIACEMLFPNTVYKVLRISNKIVFVLICETSQEAVGCSRIVHCIRLQPIGVGKRQEVSLQ